MGVLAVSNQMRTGIMALVAALVFLLNSSAANAQATSRANESQWSAPRPSVLYLPALDVSGGGIYEHAAENNKFNYVAKTALGVHRLSQTTLLTLAVQGTREGQRWVMGMDGELTHLRSGFGLQLTALRDLSFDRWGGHGALVVSYLRAGVSWYDGGLRVYSLTARIPLTLLGSWLWGGL